MYRETHIKQNYKEMSLFFLRVWNKMLCFSVALNKEYNLFPCLCFDTEENLMYREKQD